MTYNTKNYREQGGEREVIGGSLDVASGGEIDVENGAALKVAGSDVAPELAALDGSDAGVVEAGKVVTLGAYKNTDEVHTAALYLGSNAGTLVTASAVELNILDNCTATAEQLNAAATAIAAAKKVGIPLNAFHPAAGLKDALPDAGDDTSLGLADTGLVLIGTTTNNTTKTETASAVVCLDPRYSAAAAVNVIVRAKVSAARQVGATIDLTCKELVDGALGADLCTTAAQALTTSFADYTFEITATDLVQGDQLHVALSAVCDDTGGNSDGHVEIASVHVQQTVGA